MTRSTADAEFDEFVVASWARLRWSAYLLTGDHHLAEDLTQTALVKTYAVWPKVRREDALAYTRKVLVNANIDRLRRRHLREIGGIEAEDPGPVDTGAEDRDQLVRLLATLTDRERKVVVLRHYFDLSEADVAGELGVTVGTVKSTASKALAKLRSRTDTMKGVS
jgi:RNA polymerase sigma-70 factor (sigma-E family)